MSELLVTDEYIINEVRRSQAYLSKADLMYTAEKLGIEVKKSWDKDKMFRTLNLKTDEEIMKLYQLNKYTHFGVYTGTAQELLGIDNTTLKKLAKKNIIRVMYYGDSKMYGKHVNVPYYSLEDMKITKEQLDQLIEENCKKATPKQLESLEKARQKQIENRTCTRCKHVVEKKSIYDGICIYCREAEEEQEIREDTINTCKKYIDENWLILDTETTGLSDDDKIIEIAIIDLKGNVLLDTLVDIDNDKEINEMAFRVHGISRDMLVGKPSLKDLAPTLDKIFEGRKVVIYNKSFDMGMLENNGYKANFEAECLMELSSRFLNDNNSEYWRWISLSKAIRMMDINIIQEHRAISDCNCCELLIYRFAEMKR